MKRLFALLLIATTSIVFCTVKLYPYDYQMNFSGSDTMTAPYPGNQTSKTETKTIPDPAPIRQVNKFFFNVNDKLYFYLLKPVAKAYSVPLPQRVRVSIQNMIHNIFMPVRFLNCLLQGKIKGSAVELTRFVVNSTLGMAGAVDVASKMGLEEHDEDFGQTLGVYGMGPVSYLDLPLIGPSCVRDAIGIIADNFSNPLFYISPEAYLIVNIVKRVNYTSLTIGDYEDLKKDSLDPYVALRNAYYQYRLEQIKR